MGYILMVTEVFHDIYDVVSDTIGNVYLLYFLLDLNDNIWICYCGYVWLRNYIYFSQDFFFFFSIGEGAPYPEHKSVRLHLAKRGSTGAAVWYLGGNDNKWFFQPVCLPLDSDLLLFHGLEQCRLGAGGGTVEFISQNYVGEDGPGHKDSGAVRAVEIEAQNITGHQVGGALHSLEAAPNCNGESTGKGSFSSAGQTLDKHVPLAQQGYQKQFL